MAAAGVNREDMLTIADYYASLFSSFQEEPGERYTHSTKQDASRDTSFTNLAVFASKIEFTSSAGT